MIDQLQFTVTNTITVTKHVVETNIITNTIATINSIASSPNWERITDNILFMGFIFAAAWIITAFIKR